MTKEEIEKICVLKNRHNSIIQRCYNDKNENYDNYGGRGIKVSERWKDYLNFIEDLLPLFVDIKLSIDRIDNEGDYCLENVRFANAKQQANNTRRTLKSERIINKISDEERIEYLNSIVGKKMTGKKEKDIVINTLNYRKYNDTRRSNDLIRKTDIINTFINELGFEMIDYRVMGQQCLKINQLKHLIKE